MLVFSHRIGPITTRVTAELSATEGGAVELAIKQISAVIPLAWALRGKVIEAIRDNSPIPCRINERGNLEFTFAAKVRFLTCDLDLAA